MTGSQVDPHPAMNADSAWAALCEEHGAEHVWATAKDTLFELGFKAGARVAVVRPTSDMTPEKLVQIADLADQEPVDVVAFWGASLLLRRWADEIARTEVAVVRPTRDSLADVIADVMRAFDDDELTDAETEGEDWTLAEIIANVLARKYGLGLVAVSDSQETPG